MKKNIYLDYAAATPMDPQVLAAMQPYFTGNFYNPSALYLAATAVKAEIETARESVARWLGARPGNIVFTAGGTEANNLALFGVVRQYPEAHIVSTAIEHDSILKPLERLKQQGYDYTLVTPKADGVVDPARIADAITDKTVLVSVMYANNEIGTIQPLREIAQSIKSKVESRKKDGNVLPLYLHTDACQAGVYLDLHVARLGVDLMTINGGKIYGPKQSGVLYTGSHVRLEPIVLGGGQEHGARSGTENVAGIVGFATALDMAQTNRVAERSRLTELQDLFMKELAVNLPSATVTASLRHRLPNNIHITIPGTDNERLIFALDEAGIQAAAGSACSASSEEASHVLKALGMTDDEARASLRFSMGRQTTAQDVMTATTALAKIVA